jgi:hypothetical protein
MLKNSIKRCKLLPMPLTAKLKCATILQNSEAEACLIRIIISLLTKHNRKRLKVRLKLTQNQRIQMKILLMNKVFQIMARSDILKESL